MKFRTLLLPALLLLALVSCKKDEDEYSYLEGTFKITTDMPDYVNAGGTYKFSVSGITAPDGSDIGYTFTNPITKKVDTTSVYSFTVPEDTLGRFAISISAFAINPTEKYYVSPTSVPFSIVSDTGSLSGYPHRIDGGTAELYGHIYETFKCGDTEWLGSNLSYIEYDINDDPTFGYPYESCVAMQNIMGSYYTWEEAMTACPEGWRLPSEEDWVELLIEAGAPDYLKPLEVSPCGAGNLMVRAYLNGETLWQFYKNVNIQASTKFY